MILAVFLFFKPAESLQFIMIIFGFLLIVNGLMHLISYFNIKSNEARLFSYELAQAIIAIVLGFVFIINTTLVSSIFPFIIGIWIIIESISRLQLAFNLRDIPNSKWSILLVLSIFNFFIGLVFIFNPFKTAEAITTVCGALLALTEAINIYESFAFLIRFKSDKK